MGQPKAGHSGGTVNMPNQQSQLNISDEESYGTSFAVDLLEQYKLYVQTAENVSARRISTSRHLLTINSALVAIYGFELSDSRGYNYMGIFIAVIGVLISIIWLSVIKSHRDMNTLKFKIIHDLESYLPVPLFKYEWEIAEQGRGKPYKLITEIERWIPILFVAIHLSIPTIMFIMHN